MRRVRLVAGAWLLACGEALAQDASLRLEPQAERIAKLHAQIGQDVMPERSRRAMADALRDFEAALSVATQRAASPEPRDSYLLLRLLWRDYRAWALKPSTPDVARQLEQRREEIAWVAARGAGHPGRSGSAVLALEAARIAAAAQRLARQCFLRPWGIGAAATAAERALAAARLRDALGRLRASRYNTPQIATELEVAQGQLAFLLDSLGALEAGRVAPPAAMEVVAKAADHIHQALERAAALYEGVVP